MRPKGKLFALLAIFAAIGLVTATGAFTSVEATRTAEVNVAGDAAALLQLQPVDGPNGFNPSDGGTTTDSEGYAQLTSTDGELEINLVGDFDGDNELGSGINNNATTDIQAVFNITNAGTESVTINITDTGPNDETVTFYRVGGADTKTSGGLEGDESGTTETLSVGSSMEVSIYINTVDTNLDPNAELVDEVTINATTTS